MSTQLHAPPPAAADAVLNRDQVTVTAQTLLESLSDAREITYGMLKEAHRALLTEELLARGKSLQRIDNSNTALNAWMKEFDLTDESPVGPEFAEQFNSCLDTHIRTLQRQGKAKQTIDDRRSLLGKYRETWALLLRSQRRATAVRDFAGALRALLGASGVPVSQVARETGIDAATLRAWADGQYEPGKKRLSAVHRLEEFFRLPFGALAAKMPRFAGGRVGQPQTGLTGYRRHLQTAMGIRYALPELPPLLREEFFGGLYKFYTDAVWLRAHGLRRNSKWREREKDGRCPTAVRILYLVRRFYGYMCLAPDQGAPVAGGKGFLLGELTLAMLSDSDHVYDYLQFKRERTYLRQYNSDTKTFLRLCLALLRPETGYLWQSPALGARLPSPVPAEEWHAWCARHRAVLKAIDRGLTKEGEYKKTRDPFEPIRGIIVNNQHPLDVLHDLADEFEADRPPANASPPAKAQHFQLLFLIRFATVLPLRGDNFATMTYRADNTGNLYQKADGSWWVRFSADELKNHHGAAKDNPLDVPLHGSLRPYVEDFLSVHRPHLVGATECDYIFRREVARKGAGIDEPVTTEHLSRRIYILTQAYILGCPGFRLHAFRHLVATEYIKNNPTGYTVAAGVLHDREETVRECYAWVAPADRFVHWNQYVDAQHERRRREREEAAEGVL
jgi:integrase